MIALAFFLIVWSVLFLTIGGAILTRKIGLAGTITVAWLLVTVLSHG